MANKSILVVFLIVLLGISLIITIPILTLSSGLSNYGTIDELLNFEYAPDNSSPIEKLNLNVDVGDVEIRYINPPVDYFAKIEVFIEMSGVNLAGKSYSDFFDIDWQNDNSPANFSMEFKSDVNESKVLSLIKNITIVVNLRADIIFDIIATVKEGDVQVNVPYMVSVNNLVINTTKGDILYDLNHCILEGNITGIASEGNIELMANAITINNVDVNTNVGNILYDFQYCTLEGNITGIANEGNIDLMAYNPEYTRNIIWTYESNGGDITIDIIHSNQYKIMKATITGSLVGNDYGHIIVNYFDNTANIGAIITLNNTRQQLKFNHISDWENGFELEVLKDPFGYEFTSTDFPAITNYNLFLEIDRSETISNNGWYEVHLSSS